MVGKVSAVIPAAEADSDVQLAQNDASTEADQTTADSHQEDSVTNIVEFFCALRKLRESAKVQLLQWVLKRQQTIEKLQELSDSLHNDYRNSHIAGVTGAGVATASFGLVLGGFIASFFTFGAGLIVSAVGAGVGAAGGLTMTGSKLAEYILSQSKTKLAQQALDEDREASEALRSCFEELDLFFARNSAFIHSILLDPTRSEGYDTEREQATFPGLFPDDPDDGSTRNELNDNVARFLRALTAGATVGTSATAAGISAGRAIFNTLTTAGRAAHIAGFAASAAMLPLDIYFLVKSSIVLHKGSTSEAVTQIRKILDDLTCPGNDEVPELVDAYVREKFVEVGNGLVEKPEVSPSPD